MTEAIVYRGSEWFCSFLWHRNDYARVKWVGQLRYFCRSWILKTLRLTDGQFAFHFLRLKMLCRVPYPIWIVPGLNLIPLLHSCKVLNLTAACSACQNCFLLCSPTAWMFQCCAEKLLNSQGKAKANCSRPVYQRSFVLTDATANYALPCWTPQYSQNWHGLDLTQTVWGVVHKSGRYMCVCTCIGTHTCTRLLDAYTSFISPSELYVACIMQITVVWFLYISCCERFLSSKLSSCGLLIDAGLLQGCLAIC